MSMIQVMTELEAVNEMLMSIGQAPVNTLNVTGIRDVNVARAELVKVSRRVQTRGWNFNTDDAYVLTPDVDGIVLIPSGALKVIPQVGNQYATRRHAKGMALYDRDNMTFKFAAAATVQVVWGFAFEDLPETARAYVATAAGRKFQARVIGSPILDRFEEADEMQAWFLLERDERASRKTNLFHRNASMQSLFSRSYQWAPIPFTGTRSRGGVRRAKLLHASAC